MKRAFLSLVVLFGCSVFSFGDEAPKGEQAILDTLLDAVKTEDLVKFESVCDEAMKEAMTAEVLKGVSGQLSGWMKEGYETKFMGVLSKGEVKVLYWKVNFKKDGVDDVLAELSIRGGKVAGFFVR